MDRLFRVVTVTTLRRASYDRQGSPASKIECLTYVGLPALTDAQRFVRDARIVFERQRAAMITMVNEIADWVV